LLQLNTVSKAIKLKASKLTLRLQCIPPIPFEAFHSPAIDPGVDGRHLGWAPMTLIAGFPFALRNTIHPDGIGGFIP
jgi:hypothetical protein